MLEDFKLKLTSLRFALQNRGQLFRLESGIAFLRLHELALHQTLFWVSEDVRGPASPGAALGGTKIFIEITGLILTFMLIMLIFMLNLHSN